MSTSTQHEIDAIVADRDLFNQTVYTSLEDALVELDTRKDDPKLAAYISRHMKSGDIPSIMKGKRNAVLHRQIVTPNYEVGRFASIADALEMNPIFFEYHKDKFVPENDWKYALGHLGFYKGKGKKGGLKIEHRNIIDFNSANGKKLGDIRTLWGQHLTTFHHEALGQRFPKFKHHMFDASEWYEQHGQTAKNYYHPFLAMFLRENILFENFMLDSKELSFTKEVFLPAVLQIIKETGKKPLIVALEPTEIEEDHFWMCYPHESLAIVDEHLKMLK